MDYIQPVASLGNYTFGEDGADFVHALAATKAFRLFAGCLANEAIASKLEVADATLEGESYHIVI